MKQTILIPESEVVHSINEIIVNLYNKQVVIRVNKTKDGEGISSVVRFDIMDFFAEKGYTEAQIAGIKDMYKSMVAKAFGVTEEDLEDEIFSVEEPEP